LTYKDDQEKKYREELESKTKEQLISQILHSNDFYHYRYQELRKLLEDTKYFDAFINIIANGVPGMFVESVKKIEFERDYYKERYLQLKENNEQNY